MKIPLNDLFPGNVCLDKFENKFVLIHKEPYSNPEHFYFLPFGISVFSVINSNCILANTANKNDKTKIHYQYLKGKDKRFLDPVEVLENENDLLTDQDWMDICTFQWRMSSAKPRKPIKSNWINLTFCECKHHWGNPINCSMRLSKWFHKEWHQKEFDRIQNMITQNEFEFTIKNLGDGLMRGYYFLKMILK